MNSLPISDYLVLKAYYSNSEILNIAETAHREGKKTVLYSVPDCKIRKKLLKYVSVAVFDEFQMGEVSQVSINGLSSLKNAMLRLYGRGVDMVIVKMRSGGALVFAEERFFFLEESEEKLHAEIPELKLKS